MTVADRPSALTVDSSVLPDEEAGGIYRDLDRLSHALLAAFTVGISPISLLQAWQDWLLHLGPRLRWA